MRSEYEPFLLVHEDVDAVACNRNSFFYTTKAGSGGGGPQMVYEVEAVGGKVRQHLLDAAAAAPVLACTSDRLASIGRSRTSILLLDVSTAALQRLRLPDSLPIMTLACGWSHAVALAYNGAAFSWGAGGSRRLGKQRARHPHRHRPEGMLWRS